MKTHLHPRVLLFYGSAVALVIGLFRVTALYGEHHLKAPPNVNGQYLSTAALPGCPEVTGFAIMLQQSGIYLNGSLQVQQDAAASSPHDTPTEESPPLHGLWQQEQLSLTGTTDALTDCRSQAGPASPVDLQGRLNPDKTTLTGQLTIGGIAQPLEFTAQRQAETKPKSPGH